ncbi:MAG TPA: cell surface protein SprA, partial [Fibrobacteria bacterium]|nr:cell surface protein SprA [Fibrobacteria bacterium]
QAYYTELNTYSSDMGELAWRRKWLAGLIGQEEASSAGPEGMLDIVLPVNVPDWMKRIGVDKPRLRINGSYKLFVEGSRISGSGAPGGGDSWFPNLHMDQQPAFSVKGSIGRLINIEINSEEGFGTNLKEQLKITYKGEGDELEDDIIQEIEAGNTSLALTGTSLTGYTETHKGLFGLKMRMKFGDLEVTTIASQEGGSQEKQKLGLGSTFSEFVVEDRAMRLHQHFFLRLRDREDYRDPANWSGSAPAYLSGGAGRRPLQVYRLLVGNEETGVADTSQACAYDLAGNATAVCEAGRWKPFTDAEYYYDERLRMLTVPGGHRNLSLAVRWQGDPVPPLPSGARDNNSLVLIHSRTLVGVPVLDSLMWRNVYNIGKIAKQDRDQFRMRVVDKDSAEKAPGDSLTFLRRLGLEHPQKPGQVNFDNQDIFNFDQGYMVLPCRGGVGEEDDRQNCLTPMRRITDNADLYTRNVDEVSSGSTAIRFLVTGRNRKSTFDVRETSHSVSGSQCFDITPGTERLVLNGSTVLVRNQDYEVLYETGQITLTSARARDPNADIEVDYECNPPFQIQDKVLLGTRLEYKLDGISEESILGATFLYKSQTTTAERPELGREPFNQMLWGFNARLTGAPKWMTRAVNLVPFVSTEAPSKALFDFEVAQSRYNPNTKSSAYLDNFEGSENILSMPTTIYSWFQASPPAYDSLGNPSDLLDYRHQGRFWWHSNIREQYSRIYGKTASRVTDQREQVLLKLTLEPNDNLEGNSWGGVMRGLTSGLFNQSRKRVLEVVVHGRSGKLHVDLGQISEDISLPAIDFGRPDGKLQSEVRVGLEVVNKNDLVGLDGLDDKQEKVVRWECRPTCFGLPVDSLDGDPAGDKYDLPESNETEGGPSMNGTEGNNDKTYGYAFDTEDLDRSGVLDTRDLFLRYSIDLGGDCNAGTHCEPLRNNWRKYQIPLYGSGRRIGATAGESDAQILSTVKMARVWLGNLPRRVSKAQVLIARMNLVGNAWEEGDRNRDFEIDSDRYTSDDFRDSAAIRVPPAVSDSNRLRVDIINKQEEKSYQPSPNTKIERDTRTDEPMPERSLVLRYENLHAGEVVHAT